MKQSAMLRRCLALTVLAVALFVLVPGAPAQNTGPATAEQQQKSPTDDEAVQKIDIQLKDVTVGQVVELLRKKFPNTNFVLGSGVDQVPVAYLNLHQINIEGAIQAVRYATEGQVDTKSIPGGWVILGRPVHLQVEAFNLTGYLQSLGSKDEKGVEDDVGQVTRIIDETMKLRRGSMPAENLSIRFHRGANLLVVVGSPEAIDVAHKIVEALPTANPSPQLILRSFQLKYVRPEDILSSVQTVLADKRSKATVDDRNSVLFVRATEPEFREIEEIVKSLDVPNDPSQQRPATAAPGPRNLPAPGPAEEAAPRR